MDFFSHFLWQFVDTVVRRSIVISAKIVKLLSVMFYFTGSQISAPSPGWNVEVLRFLQTKTTRSQYTCMGWPSCLGVQGMVGGTAATKPGTTGGDGVFKNVSGKPLDTSVETYRTPAVSVATKSGVLDKTRPNQTKSMDQIWRYT